MFLVRHCSYSFKFISNHYGEYKVESVLKPPTESKFTSGESWCRNLFMAEFVPHVKVLQMQFLWCLRWSRFGEGLLTQEMQQVFPLGVQGNVEVWCPGTNRFTATEEDVMGQRWVACMFSGAETVQHWISPFQLGSVGREWQWTSSLILFPSNWKQLWNVCVIQSGSGKIPLMHHELALAEKVSFIKKKKNKKQNKQKKTTTNPRKTQIWQNIKGLTKPTRVGGIRIIDFGFCAAIGPLKWNMLRLKAFELSSPSLGLKAFEPLTMSMRSFTSSLQKARDVWNFPDVFSSWRVSCCSFSGKQMKCVLLHPITELLAHVAFLGWCDKAAVQQLLEDVELLNPCYAKMFVISTLILLDSNLTAAVSSYCCKD